MGVEGVPNVGRFGQNRGVIGRWVVKTGPANAGAWGWSFCPLSTSCAGTFRTVFFVGRLGGALVRSPGPPPRVGWQTRVAAGQGRTPRLVNRDWGGERRA